jgi:glycosyltransferase involved in cell wall biosynthesis
MKSLPSRTVVLDDRSTDCTASLASGVGAEVVIVPGDGGLGRARNLGLDIAAGGLAAFLNADCMPQSGWLATLRAAMDRTGATVVGGKQVEIRDETWAERWKALHLRQDLGDELIIDPDFLSGGNLLVDLTRIGTVRFDARYREAYEDVAFCRALRAEGRRLVYEPSAVVGHDHRETLWTLPRKVWSYGVHSRAVGPVHSLRRAPRAFLRMHSRPNDQIRRALAADLKCARVWSLAIDLYLLARSFVLFIGLARKQSVSHDVPISPDAGEDQWIPAHQR